MNKHSKLKDLILKMLDGRSENILLVPISLIALIIGLPFTIWHKWLVGEWVFIWLPTWISKEEKWIASRHKELG